MFVDRVSSEYLKSARYSLIMCRSRKPFEVKKEKKKEIKTYLSLTIFFPGYFHLCFICFILGWLFTTENAEMKIKRLLSKHLAPGSAKVSGFGVLMVCFAVNIWIWCWISLLLVIYKNLLHEQCEGGCMCMQAGEYTQVLSCSWDIHVAVMKQLLTSSQLIPHSCPAGTCRTQWESKGTILVASLFLSHWCCYFQNFIKHQRYPWWAGESRENPEVLKEIIQICVLC